MNIAEASADGYVGDLAVLVHKLKDMENLNVLFVLARMENRIFFVARSRIPEVDVGAIARDFGGGGHPTAASATVKDLTLFQIREQLLALLSEHLKPRDEKEKVRDHMTFPVKSMRVDDTIAEAAETLNRYNINSLPILEGERVCGILTRQVVEKACYHGLKKNKVSEIMSSDFVTLSPDDPLRQAQDLLLKGVQRFIPVLEEERLVGVALAHGSVAQHRQFPADAPQGSPGGRTVRHGPREAGGTPDAREAPGTRVPTAQGVRGDCRVARDARVPGRGSGARLPVAQGQP